MIRSLLFFVAVWIAVMVGIKTFRSLTGADKWSVVKLVGYGAACATIAVFAIMGIVVAF
jgi:hypothetical protein